MISKRSSANIVPISSDIVRGELQGVKVIVGMCEGY